MSQSNHKIAIKDYIIGFISAIVLTVISFGIVIMKDSFSKPVIYSVLSVAAILQMLIQLRYFLHLDGSKEKRWDVIAISFTALLLFIFVAGTIWVMITLNSRMM